MFLQASVILFTGGGWQTPPRADPPWADTPLPDTLPQADPPMATAPDGTHPTEMHSCFYIKIVALQEISFEDVFTLQKVTQTEAANFNFVSGTVPLLRNMCLDVRLKDLLELDIS